MTAIATPPSAVVPDAVSLLESHRRWRAVNDAQETEIFAALLAHPDPYGQGKAFLDKEFVVEDVACAMRLAPVTAEGRMHRARELVSRFPTTVAAMHEGRLDCRYSDRLLKLTAHLSDEDATAVEAEALPGVDAQTVSQWMRAIRRAIARIAPEKDDERRAEAMTQRRVAVTPRDDGMCEVWALIPAEDAVALESLVRQHAKALGVTDRDTHPADCAECGAGGSCGAELRTLEQRRADAFVQLVLGELGGLHPRVNITIPLSTLLELSDEPGDLDGYGPLTAAVARAIAFDPTGRWRRLVCDEHGRLVDVTSTTYRPPEPMRRFVNLRDQTCRFPMCNRRAVSCETDHVTPWPRGRTTACNLIPLCSRHHHLKHDGRWGVERRPDGSVRWTNPFGKVYVKPPPPPLRT